MANALWPTFKQDLLDKLHDLNTDNIVAMLQKAGNYTYSGSDHFVSAVTAGGATVARSGTLASPTIASGVFDTADFTWTAVATTTACAQIILENNNGNSAASDAARMLIAFYDTGMTGMPVTPNGGDINVTVNASGWFSL